MNIQDAVYKECDKEGRKSNEMTPCAVDNEVELTHDPKKHPRGWLYPTITWK